MDWDQQPPMPTTRAGSSLFSRLASPRCPSSRLSAFSRIEQVLKRIRSAAARSSASAYPIDSSMPFIRSESCSFIWHPKVVTWYDGMRWRVALLRVVDRARLAHHRHLDLAGVLELVLDLSRDLVREQRRGVVVERTGLDHHPNLAPRLHRVDLLDAVVALGDRLEVAQALDVVLQRLAARAGPGAGQRVRSLHDHGLDGLRLDL